MNLRCVVHSPFMVQKRRNVPHRRRHDHVLLRQRFGSSTAVLTVPIHATENSPKLRRTSARGGNDRASDNDAYNDLRVPQEKQTNKKRQTLRRKEESVECGSFGAIRPSRNRQTDLQRHARSSPSLNHRARKPRRRTTEQMTSQKTLLLGTNTNPRTTVRHDPYRPSQESNEPAKEKQSLVTVNPAVPARERARRCEN